MPEFVIIAFTFILIAIAYWIYRCSRPLPWVVEQIKTFGTANIAHTALPKIIWTYWHSEELPLLVKQCIAGWRRLNPEYQVHVITAANMAHYVESIPEQLAHLNIAKQTDWLRLTLLKQYGGVWLDASIILTQPLAHWLEPKLRADNVEFTGFYLDKYNATTSYPVIDSWFLAAKPGSAFIVDWLQVFEQEVIINGTEQYLAKLAAEQRLAAYQQNITGPDYHTVHVAAQQVIQQADAAERYHLLLLRAEDSAFLLQQQLNWKRRRLYWRLLALNVENNVPVLIKLRGGERRKLEGYLKLGLYRRHSIVGRYLFGCNLTSAEQPVYLK